MVVTGDRLNLGFIPAARLAELSDGRLSVAVPVLLRSIGISGGNRYLSYFPASAALKVIEVSHWPGALITSAKIIGSAEPIGYWRQPVAVGGVGRCATPVVTSAGRRLVRFAIGMQGTTWSWGLPRARRGGSEHGTTGRGRSARYASGAAPARYR